MRCRLIFLVFIIFFVTERGNCERIKDIADIKGIRGNPLFGVGLVVGLAGTGDGTLPPQRMLTNILRRSGIFVSSNQIGTGNIALVLVEAELGPFSNKGASIDVDVSSIGDAESLQGGKLLITELFGADGQVYAIANGSITLGGWGASGKKASVKKNHLVVGRIPSGAIVEKEEKADFVENIDGERFITFNLRNVDFSTSERISSVINGVYGDIAIAEDAGTIHVKVPEEILQKDISKFIAGINGLEVLVDVPAVIVINERTGTIVVGENVGISGVAISQGSLIVKVRETKNVFQPTASFSDAGDTIVVSETELGIEERTGYLIPVATVVTVSELAKALNAIGATPTDLVAIFNALKEAGALQARLKIM